MAKRNGLELISKNVKQLKLACWHVTELLNPGVRSAAKPLIASLRPSLRHINCYTDEMKVKDWQTE